MSIKAEIVADSKNEYGNRLTTFKIVLPRILLAEVNTHRMLSKNTASSRAIPFPKLLEMVKANPFIPIAWQKDHKGMQGMDYFTEWYDIELMQSEWLMARDHAVRQAEYLSKQGLTKQLCNRLLEPFMWCTMLISGTEWENFFHLRCPRYLINVGPDDNDASNDIIARSWRDLMSSPYTGDFDTNDTLERLSYNKGMAEIHMMALAECMWDAYNESQPRLLKAGEWHAPYANTLTSEEFDKLPKEIFKGLTQDELSKKTSEIIIKICTVMAARTSYTVVGADQKPLTYQRMIEIHDDMATADPLHMSPFEHCAEANDVETDYNVWMTEGLKGFSNFRGFTQYRKMIPNENKII